MAGTKQNPDGSMGIYSEAEGVELLRIGGPANPQTGGNVNGVVTNSQANYRGVFTVKIPLINGTANITGGCGLWVNPFPEKLLIGLTSLQYNTGQTATHSISAGTLTMSSGIDPKGNSNNLIDGYNYNTLDTTPVPNNIDNKGSAGAATRVLGVGEALGVYTNRQLGTANLTLYVDVRKV